MRAVEPDLLVITNWRDGRHGRSGGAEAVCEEVARRWVAAGRRVVLLCAAVPGVPAVERTAEGYVKVRSGGEFTVYPRALLWLLRHRGRVAGVLDSQNGIPFFTPLAVSRRTPVLLLLHHVHQDQFGQYFSPVAAAVGRWLESTGSRLVYGRRSVVAVSPSTRTEARRRLGLRGELSVVPPGWTTALDVGGVRRPRTKHPSIVTVGRVVPHKRVHLLVEAVPAALRSHPDLQVHLVGTGSELPRLQALVDQLGLEGSVVLHGELSSADRDGLLATAWMTVQASEGEGWGLSVIEANALGVPALAFRRPGLQDSIVDRETGWLCDEGADLGTAIATAVTELHDRQVAADYAMRCLAWAARFTWDAMADHYLGLMAAEGRRLALPARDRRSRSDVATVVQFDDDLVAPPPVVRETDLVLRSGGSTVVLLRGADMTNAEAVVGRVRGDRAASSGAASIRAARPRDHLAPRVERRTVTTDAVPSEVAPPQLPEQGWSGRRAER